MKNFLIFTCVVGFNLNALAVGVACKLTSSDGLEINRVAGFNENLYSTRIDFPRTSGYDIYVYGLRSSAHTRIIKIQATVTEFSNTGASRAMVTSSQGELNLKLDKSEVINEDGELADSGIEIECTAN